MGTPDYSFARYEYNLGDYKDGYLPQILRVSRQLRQEGTAYLYHRKTFIITVYHTGFDFLKGSGQLQTLPNLPFYEMKEFVIRIPPHTLRTHGTRLRGSLVWLCGLLHQSGARFKKLRIDFTDQLSEWDPWPKEVPLWEYTDDSPESIPTELLLNDEEEWYTNFEYLAWREGCYSTWEWLVSPLAMLSGVADKCIIDIPRSYQGNKHYEDVKVCLIDGGFGICLGRRGRIGKMGLTSALQSHG
ncbi:MAG: hypothetical protein L6R40_005251 [Gallowayella cf. fulva]|nr:MAG: hypothetical protein L6R40_005251 [Xanthomendoza cf. fulva]